MHDKFPHTAIQCLTAIAQHHGLQINPERLIDDYALRAEEPGTGALLRIASDIGLKAKADKLTWSRLMAQGGVFPLMARLVDGNMVIAVGVKPGENGAEDQVAVLNPVNANAAVVMVGRADFEQRWHGDVLFIKRQHKLNDPNQPFGLRWFIPEILKQKSAFRDIFIAAIAMQLLALASPIFFQLVIDKVLTHQSVTTLQVLAVGIIAALVFDATFGFLRQTLTLAASNKIDMRLTRRVFSHLLSLPIDFFETTSAGVVTRHMQQLEKIRSFLTGRLFFTALDLIALLVFVPILFSYSFKLAMIVLLFAAMIAGVVMAMVPTFQRRLNALYSAEGQRQGMLVETIHGMRTVKALAIEPSQRRIWDQRSAEAITMHFRVGQISIAGNAVTDFLGKLLPVTLIVVGAADVFDSTLSVGALIAFQMLSGRVTQPLISIVGLVNEYQETALSVRMLGEVMNRAPEGRAGANGLRPILQGEIRFDDVTFRYPGAQAMALDKARFTIEPGTVVGIVGRSGSGKTTLTKLIQGLYPVQEGIVRFDGIDAREIELSHLRRQIGVVLQENFLFRGTVRENLSVTKPDATFEELVEAAAAAGADEFIERLPMGYDTVLEENASNLSGGQKQRLSIARTLVAKPRILILDEAASALDPESEAIFISNLSRIAVGRTVVMISHRLSTLVNADKIMVMQQGRLMDAGRHEELLTRSDTYQHLWNQQTSHL
ncbi:peptidase domain-containing ABC transporter [Duganella sp. BJB488]|uniref:peptidase domain-containing ABC transporter n=1 Tax=unclassified Duganella TaxID=2636909 RepID=UPI000E3420F6|nr:MULTISPECIES: peptidase domain-containing ABC transporter [unclassified Duganella]RFP09856.1 peptidase domain-containing ABC transporter [Duganella sp. BJB489]RFP13486.1 peptidase domain-containing ABC transporter [Duganella sp. BJB488]RFP29425.1 peptidase domain-containing ABC transporter [Duganella sp. BJB480]